MKHRFKRYYNIKRYNSQAVSNVSSEIVHLQEIQRSYKITYGCYSESISKEINEMKELFAYLYDLEE